MKEKRRNLISNDEIKCNKEEKSLCIAKKNEEKKWWKIFVLFHVQNEKFREKIT